MVQGEVADIEKTNIILTPEQQKVKDSIESLLVNDFINEAIKIKEKSKLPEKIMQSTEIQQAIKKTIIHK
ncbi:hypothetical protein KJ557_03010 [Patescibacteria group bacterium]|nr:hypothetical protein [Patescibacteria group bacterium]